MSRLGPIAARADQFGTTSPAFRRRAKVRNRCYSDVELQATERVLLPDSVEEVLVCSNRGGADRRCDHGCECRVASGRRDRRRHRDQLGELAEVLGCGGEMELVAGTVRPS
jgi:hypothetical protein